MGPFNDEFLLREKVGGLRCGGRSGLEHCSS